jgi:transcriptional regulator with XRE-family HTH domain
MANKRSVRPDGEAVRRARLTKGWRVEDLASHSDCSIGTVENVERSEDVYVNTLASIALALKVGYATLLAKPETSPCADGNLRTKAFIIISTNLDDPLPVRQVVDELTARVPLVDEVVVGTTQVGRFRFAPDGGLLINMTLTYRDARELSAKYHAGELASLDVRTFSAPGCSILGFTPLPVEPD